jgi:hypothetical protein
MKHFTVTLVTHFMNGKVDEASQSITPAQVWTLSRWYGRTNMDQLHPSRPAQEQIYPITK